MIPSSPEATRHLLEHGTLEVEGRLSGASNATLRCIARDGGLAVRCVYKPVAGERPLWDFAEGSLAGREVAFAALDDLLGWGLVPPTVWRDEGPYGAGSCQLWIEADAEATVVDLVPVADTPDGWAVVLEGRDQAGRTVRLIHATTREVQQLALLDAMANNADRKGGHILVDATGRVWGIDHGVTFHAEFKLRSVLWGWAGEPIPDDLLDDIARLEQALGADGAEVIRWLTRHERAALLERVRRLRSSACFPHPSPEWPSIPWPVF